jgi:hypothetical protein
MEIHDFSLDHPQIKIVNGLIFRKSIFIPSSGFIGHLFITYLNNLLKAFTNLFCLSLRSLQATQLPKIECVKLRVEYFKKESKWL